MKIFLNLLAALLFVTWQTEAQKPPQDFRYKMRLPPQQLPARLTPAQQYMRKKLEQIHPSRLPNRPRPIPMHLGQNFISPPVGPPVMKPHFRPTPIPHRNPYKSPKIVYQPNTEKPFQSSQLIGGTHEFDYHVQTNSIPTNSIPIKQVGEKGPIHTIPAPNLSLADKPQMVEEVHQEVKFDTHRPKPQQHQHSFIQQTFLQPQAYIQQQNLAQPPQSFVQPQQNYAQSQQTFQYVQDPQGQYQVSESNDQFPKGSEKIKSQVYFQQQQEPKYKKQQNVQFGKLPDPFDQSELSSEALYDLIKPHLQQQQQQQQTPQVYFPQKSSENAPVSFTEVRDSSGDNQLFKPNKSYMTQVQHQLPNRANQVFAYERHAPTNDQSSENESGFITTNYNFKAADQTELRSPYIQEVFDHQINSPGNVNVIELNRKPNQIEETAYFANQQLADTLASLQASGNFNVDGSSPMQIYVSDEQFGQSNNQVRAVKTGDSSASAENEQNSENFEIIKSLEQDLGQSKETQTEPTTTTKRTHFRGRQGSYGSRTKAQQN